MILWREEKSRRQNTVQIEWMTDGFDGAMEWEEISLKMVHNLYYYHANVSLLIFESDEIDADHMCAGCILHIVWQSFVHFGKIVKMHDAGEQNMVKNIEPK